MKKCFRISILILCFIILTGCKFNGVTKCKGTTVQKVSNYTEKKEYSIYKKKNYVKKIEMKKVVDTKNNTIRLYFENLDKKKYEELNKNYGGIKYNVSVKGNKLITEVTINYKKFDMKKYVETETDMKSYVDKNNKLTYEGAVQMVELEGLKCEK